jgi:hypothetical protein
LAPLAGGIRQPPAMSSPPTFRPGGGWRYDLKNVGPLVDYYNIMM